MTRRPTRKLRPAVSPVFRAVADPTRRAILDRLAAGPLNAGQIAAAFPISRPAISKHLGILRTARLIGEERQGRRRIYHLRPQNLQEIDDWLTGYRLFWAARLVELKEMVESTPDTPHHGESP